MKFLAVPLANHSSSAVLAASTGDNGEYWFVGARNGKVLTVNAFSTSRAADSLVEAGLQDYLDRQGEYWRMGDPTVVAADLPPRIRSESGLMIWAMGALRSALDTARDMRIEAAIGVRP